MRRIGLIGGLSWTASAEYYRIINQEVQNRLGGHHSAELLLRSLDFATILALADDRAMVEDILYDAAQALIEGGARYLAIASFTGHSYAHRIRHLPVPLIDLAEVVGEAIRARGFDRIGILATGRSLTDGVLLDSLAGGGWLDIFVPPAAVQDGIDSIIFDELAVQADKAESIAFLDASIANMLEAGAQAILLGTTEFSRIQGRLAQPGILLDAAIFHCHAIVDNMLDSDGIDS